MAGIAVTFTRKQVKNINLRLSLDGSHVRVSAPWLVPLWRVEAFVGQRRHWIEQQQCKLQQRHMQRQKQPQNLQAKRQLAARLEQFLPLWQERLGVQVKSCSIRNMHTRWGSCTPARGTIRISLGLQAYPDECLEYVLVHELTHLLEPSHNARFHALVESVMPDWRSRKALLEGS